MARGPLGKEWGKQKGLQCLGSARPRSQDSDRKGQDLCSYSPLSSRGISPHFLGSVAP